MLKNVISQGDFSVWPIAATLIFAVTFVGILIWTWRKGSKNHYQYMSNLTMDEGNKQTELKHG